MKVELRFVGMADDALAILPLEKPHWLKLVDDNGKEMTGLSGETKIIG